MPLEPLICRSRYNNIKKSYKNKRKFGESKNTHTFAMFKKNKSINRSTRNNKNKKIMNIEETKNERYVEIYATNNEGTTMTIRKLVEKKEMHETFMDIYNKLTNMEENEKWDVKVISAKTFIS